MNDPFDPKLLALTGVTKVIFPPVRARGRFIKGPLDLAWISSAARLPGRALHVALAIAYRTGMTPGGVVTVPRADREAFGITRFTFSRCLAALERSGLVRVSRHVGRAPRIQILQISSVPTPAPQEGDEQRDDPPRV